MIFLNIQQLSYQKDDIIYSVKLNLSFIKMKLEGIMLEHSSHSKFH
jgi:hypothetical protein